MSFVSGFEPSSLSPPNPSIDLGLQSTAHSWSSVSRACSSSFSSLVCSNLRCLSLDFLKERPPFWPMADLGSLRHFYQDEHFFLSPPPSCLPLEGQHCGSVVAEQLEGFSTGLMSCRGNHSREGGRDGCGCCERHPGAGQLRAGSVNDSR